MATLMAPTASKKPLCLLSSAANISILPFDKAGVAIHCLVRVYE